MKTIVNIAQMTQYWMKYLQDKSVVEKMYRHVFMARAGFVCIFSIGIEGLINSQIF